MASSRWGAALFFEGKLAGMFLAEALPGIAGKYRYEAVRSPAHLEMQRAIRAGLRPRCTCTHAGQSISFAVVGSPGPGLLVLAEFRAEPS